jgi:hypothetical protein
MIHAMKGAIVKKIMYSTRMVIVLNHINVQVSFFKSDVIKRKNTLWIILGKTTKRPSLTTRPSNRSVTIKTSSSTQRRSNFTSKL